MSERLPGGNLGGALRSGDVVLRVAGPWTPAVHALLERLSAAGCAPRPLGVDGDGRERLAFVEGEVPAEAVRVDDGALAEVGRLIRRCHDATAGWSVPVDARWRALPGAPSGGGVICHNDLAPYNTVFRDGRPVAFIDWDYAAPGPPAWDLAHAVWRFAPLDAGADPLDAGRRARLLLDAYGLSEREGFIALVRERMRVLRETIRVGAEAGEPAWLAMWGTEHSERPLADRAWVARHRRALERAIASG
jgi:aminoglycoside phosphotransferase (APT) family kinase protein